MPSTSSTARRRRNKLEREHHNHYRDLPISYLDLKRASFIEFLTSNPQYPDLAMADPTNEFEVIRCRYLNQWHILYRTGAYLIHWTPFYAEAYRRFKSSLKRKGNKA